MAYTDHTHLALWPVSPTSNKLCLGGRANLTTHDPLLNADQNLNFCPASGMCFPLLTLSERVLVHGNAWYWEYSDSVPCCFQQILLSPSVLYHLTKLPLTI